ncbi:MAG: hypothetical protein AVO33_11455 [delta proteobacterium ML8_F1]|nr:MAG: hypothetical protein AVO33_11455 [delta proteobacterium ML8_F1]
MKKQLLELLHELTGIEEEQLLLRPPLKAARGALATPAAFSFSPGRREVLFSELKKALGDSPFEVAMVSGHFNFSLRDRVPLRALEVPRVSLPGEKTDREFVSRLAFIRGVLKTKHRVQEELWFFDPTLKVFFHSLFFQEDCQGAVRLFMAFDRQADYRKFTEAMGASFLTLVVFCLDNLEENA